MRSFKGANEGDRGHFDAHAYRPEDHTGVRDFARGCMRTHLILKEKAQRWNVDAEIQALLQEANGGDTYRGRAECKTGEIMLRKAR